MKARSRSPRFKSWAGRRKSNIYKHDQFTGEEGNKTPAHYRSEWFIILKHRITGLIYR